MLFGLKERYLNKHNVLVLLLIIGLANHLIVSLAGLIYSTEHPAWLTIIGNLIWLFGISLAYFKTILTINK